MKPKVLVYTGAALAQYGFGAGHPFGPDRHNAFVKEFQARGLEKQVEMAAPVMASRAELERFHTSEYIDKIIHQSKTGQGYLDCGDTPAYPGIYSDAATVVGTTLAALDRIINGPIHKAFIPIAGLHHARRDSAAGFCALNDIGVAIETCRQRYHIARIAYVDIDAHHGDGVFYAFESDPDLCFIDFHEDGRFLYPGTGAQEETGKGPAFGTKLNFPMPRQANDAAFLELWPRAEKFLRQASPELIIFQCGADSMAGDPITHLHYSAAVHRHVATHLSIVANELCNGRLLALGGGGYDRDNLAQAWCAVVEAMIQFGG